MKFRNLGSTGIRVSEIGLGTWEMSGNDWGPKDDHESLRAIQVGLDGGMNFVDTAADYGRGRAEQLIGRVLRTGCKRGAVVIATKVPPENGVFAPAPEVPIADCFSPAWIRRECEGSLKRLATDHVDVLYLHTWSRAWAHETAWYEELEKLKSEGKIRASGISVSDEGVTDANVQIALRQVDVVQCVFSTFQQEPIYSILPLAAAHGTGVVARSPFSSGVIVQKWTTDMRFPEGDWRASWPHKIQPGWLEDQIAMAEKVKPALATNEMTVAQAALAFVLAQSAVSAVIPGSANPAHVAENAAASGCVLPAATLGEVRRLWLDSDVHGTYNGSR